MVSVNCLLWLPYLYRILSFAIRTKLLLRSLLDIDATDDPAHGQQELEFFHGYYGCHCFVPLLIFATVDTGEQEMLTAVLRPGNKHAGYGSVGILRRIIRLLRASFPMCKFVVRGDAGYALPALYDWCEQEGIDYVISLAQNNRLLELASSFEEEARRNMKKHRRRRVTLASSIMQRDPGPNPVV